MTSKFITLVNLLATDDPFLTRCRKYDPQRAAAADVPYPEYLTYEDRSEEIAHHIVSWLKDDDEYGRRIQQLSQLKAKYAIAGASEMATEYILSKLPPPLPSLRGPHFDSARMQRKGKIPA
jgi:hypothetical protein